MACEQKSVDRLGRAIEAAEDEMEAALRRTTEVGTALRGGSKWETKGDQGCRILWIHTCTMQALLVWGISVGTRRPHSYVEDVINPVTASTDCQPDADRLRCLSGCRFTRAS